MLEKYIPRGRFARNIAFLASGTLLTQLLALLAIPVLSRLYSPSDFGVLATYASLLGILSVIANLRYQLAIPLADTDKEALSLLLLSIIVTVGMSLIVLLAILALDERINDWLNSEKIFQYIWVLPIGVFFVGMYQAFNYWAIREKELKVVAKTKMLQTVIMLAIQIVFYKLSLAALILGHVIGQSAGVSYLALPVIRSRIVVIKTISIYEIISISKRFKKFPLYSSWAGLLNSIGSLAPNLLFAIFFSPAAAGLFFLANRIVMLPMALLGTAIGQSFYTEAAESYKKGSLSVLTKATSKKLFFVIIIPTIMLFIAGEEVIVFLLGDQWKDSGAMIEWLSFLVFAQFITSPISSVFSISEKQLKGMVLQFILSVLKIGSIFIAYWQGLTMIDAVICFSIASFIGYLIYFITILMEVGFNE